MAELEIPPERHAISTCGGMSVPEQTSTVFRVNGISFMVGVIVAFVVKSTENYERRH